MPVAVSKEEKNSQRPIGKEEKRRSKTGCSTCRTVAKMRCDEQKPTCGRFSRLRLTCWNSGPSLRERRRGVGTWRSREDWKPSTIYQKEDKTSNDLAAQSHFTPEAIENELASPPSCHLHDPFVDSRMNDVDRIPFSDSESPHWAVSNWLSSSSLDSAVNLIFQTYTADGLGSLDQSSHDLATTPTIPQELSGFRTSSPDALMLDGLEHEALHHYSTSFSASFTKKHPRWSTLSMLLRIGSSKAMVMHLLLAVSLNDLALRRQDEDLLAAAHPHYRKGASQLIETMTNGTEPDHIGVLATFCFFYFYKMKWMRVDVDYMNQLSRTVTGHIEKHKLDALCYGTYSTAVGLHEPHGCSSTINPQDSSM